MIVSRTIRLDLLRSSNESLELRSTCGFHPTENVRTCRFCKEARVAIRILDSRRKHSSHGGSESQQVHVGSLS